MVLGRKMRGEMRVKRRELLINLFDVRGERWGGGICPTVRFGTNILIDHAVISSTYVIKLVLGSDYK